MISVIGRKLYYKLLSMPAIIILAFVGLMIGFAFYFDPLETYKPITDGFHAAVPNGDFRHLFFRAAPETLAAAWLAGPLIYSFVKKGKLKYKNTMSIPRLFIRPLVALIFAAPGMALMAYSFYLYSKFHTDVVAITGFHPPHINAVQIFQSSHASWWQKISDTVVGDGKKKLVVLAGSVFMASWIMKPEFFAIQSWFAEDYCIRHGYADDPNKVFRGRWYHHLVPNYRDRIKYEIEDGNYNLAQHQTRHNVFKWVMLAAGAGLFINGLCILIFVIHSTS